MKKLNKTILAGYRVNYGYLKQVLW